MKDDELKKEANTLISGLQLDREYHLANILSELLSRFKQGEKSAIEWAKIAGKNQSQIEKLADEIENLKCCGNCSMQKCETDRGNLDDNYGKYCPKWLSDGMKREQRLIA